MSSFIKLPWDKVFSAAVEKEIELNGKLASDREEFIEKYIKLKTGVLFWKRHYTLEEAADAYKSYVAYFGGSIRYGIKRAKDLQNLAFVASSGYDTDTDYVYLTISDANFLFDGNENGQSTS